jgi:hypothetical protein
MRDWRHACGTLVMGLELRFTLFAGLPYRLLGLSAADPEEVSAAAVDCICLWNDSKIPASHHHPVTQRFLAGQFRAFLDRLACGEPLSSMPELSLHVLQWRFLTVLERSIEAKHSLAKKTLIHNSRPSPAAISLSLRINLFTLRVCFAVCRHLSLGRHSRISALRSYYLMLFQCLGLTTDLTVSLREGTQLCDFAFFGHRNVCSGLGLCLGIVFHCCARDLSFHRKRRQ